MVDVSPAHEDAKKMKDLFVNLLNIKEENINMVQDASKRKLHQIKDHIQSRCEDAEKSGKKLCVFIYYGGHGVMCNTNYIVLNEGKNRDRFYALERQLYQLAKNYKNNFFISFYDCCRQAIAKDKMRGAGDDLEGEISDEEDNGMNSMCCYATSPSSFVSINSTFIESIKKCFSQNIVKHEGVLVLPEALRHIAKYERKAQCTNMCINDAWIDTRAMGKDGKLQAWAQKLLESKQLAEEVDNLEEQDEDEE